MKISIHVCNIPCPEEYYMGVSSSYTAYVVDIPDNIIPQDIQDIANDKIKNKSITQIAIIK